MTKKTTIVTTADALTRAADAILERFDKTDGKLTKAGLLDTLAREIAGPRQNWGGIKRHDHFTGIGAPQVTQPHQRPNGRADDGLFPPRWHNAPYGPPQSSPVVTTIAGAEITGRELYNAKIAFEVLDQQRDWSDEVRECLYDMIRPWMNNGRNENYAYDTLPELLQHVTVGPETDAGRHARVILFAWGSIRFQDRGVDDYAPAIDEVMAFIAQLDRLGWSGSTFDRFRWSYESWVDPQEAWWRENKDEAIAWLIKACEAAHETLRRDTTRKDREDLDSAWRCLPPRPAHAQSS